MTLRNALTGLAVFIALLQFPGLPHDIVRLFSMFAGLAIVFLLFISKKDSAEFSRETDAKRTVTITRGESGAMSVEVLTKDRP
jgi:hypothetical protein